MTKVKHEDSCDRRIDEQLRDRVSDLRRLWRDYNSGRDVDSFGEYGLCFDYVPAATFADQRQGYFRYQLSCGGPSDEFRFLADPDLCCYRIEYWFLDWSDGAHRVLSGADENLLLELWDWFSEIGSVQAARHEAK